MRAVFSNGISATGPVLAIATGTVACEPSAPLATRLTAAPASNDSECLATPAFWPRLETDKVHAPPGPASTVPKLGLLEPSSR